MLQRKKELLWPIVTLSLLGVFLYGYARAPIKARTAETVTSKSGSHNSAASQTGARDFYVQQGALMPQLRWRLRALGDRLEKRGKERLTLTSLTGTRQWITRIPRASIRTSAAFTMAR